MDKFRKYGNTKKFSFDDALTEALALPGETKRPKEIDRNEEEMAGAKRKLATAIKKSDDASVSECGNCNLECETDFIQCDFCYG